MHVHLIALVSLSDNIKNDQKLLSNGSYQYIPENTICIFRLMSSEK